jgi:hypothetical protein
VWPAEAVERAERLQDEAQVLPDPDQELEQDSPSLPHPPVRAAIIKAVG